MYGTIATARGSVISGQFTLDVTIPPNTTATVWVPAKDAAAVTESGKTARAGGVKFVRSEGGSVVRSGIGGL